jgi:hypothetical protein
MSTQVTKYRPGDRVSVPIETGLRWPGLVVDDEQAAAGEFCPTCHCAPPDPDHYDGTLCCPGPWYRVEVEDPSGPVGHRWTFAAHELAPIRDHGHTADCHGCYMLDEQSP